MNNCPSSYKENNGCVMAYCNLHLHIIRYKLVRLQTMIFCCPASSLSIHAQLENIATLTNTVYVYRESLDFSQVEA